MKRGTLISTQLACGVVAGDWILVSLAMESEATLNSQERGKDLEYRVIAVNKAGEGVPSNTVAAVV